MNIQVNSWNVIPFPHTINILQYDKMLAVASLRVGVWGVEGATMIQGIRGSDLHSIPGR